MQKFNPKQYVAIAVANAKGMDKLKWNERIQWVKDNYDNLELLEPTNTDKFLYRKAVRALKTEGPIKYIMDLDACNSGVQVMSVLGKDIASANASNVLGQNRNDVYTTILENLNGISLTRQQVKDATIPALYGSIAEPKKLLGEDTPEYNAFQKALGKAVPVLKNLSEVFKYVWNSEAEYHTWTTPDGHVVRCPSTEVVSTKLSTEWFNGSDSITTSINLEWKKVQPSENHIPLLVNYIHSYDGYIVREMIRRANQQGFQVAHIHDSFWAMPQYMNHVRWNYICILSELAREDHLNRNIEEINPNFRKKYGLITYKKEEQDMWKHILDSEYPLS